MQFAKDVMLTLKGDGFIDDQPPILMSQWIARTVQQQISKLPFAPFFSCGQARSGFLRELPPPWSK
jgi:hypothetical protein